MYYGMQRGDYYRGDPFLGALLGGAIKKATTWVAGRVGGSAARKAVGTTLGVAGIYDRARGAVSPILNAFPQGGGNPPGIQLPGGMTVNPFGILPGGEPFITPTRVVPVDGRCPPGWHLNKQDGKYGPAGTYCVRNRKPNPLNPRALKRSLNRAEGFEKFAKRTVRALYRTSGGKRTRKFTKFAKRSR